MAKQKAGAATDPARSTEAPVSRTVWYLQGHSGTHDDYTEWVVQTYTAEAAAQGDCDFLNSLCARYEADMKALYKVLGKRGSKQYESSSERRWAETASFEEAMRTYDPAFPFADEPGYAVKAVELRDTPKYLEGAIAMAVIKSRTT